MSLVAVFASLLIGIGGANVFYYHNESQAALGLAQAQLESIATLKVEQIENWRNERLNDVRALQDNPMLEPMLPSWLQAELTNDAKKKLVAWLDLIVSEGDYREAGLLDERGRLIAATVPILRIPPDAAALIDDVRRTGKAQIGNLYSTRDAQAMDVQAMDVVAPFQQDGTIRGFLLLRIAPERFLYPLLQKWPVQSASAETLLVEEREGLIVYLNELRHRKGTALNMSRATDDPTLPASYAVRGENAFVDGADYRAVAVLGATRAVPGTRWGVVAKVDRSEITVPLNRRLSLMLFSSMLLGLLAGGITYYLWQVQNELIREQRERDAAAREEVQRLTNRLIESQHIGNVGSWERDLATNEIWWSDETYRIFGYTPAELPLPTFESFLARVHPEDRPGMELIIQSGVASGKPYTIDYRIVLPGGDTRILQNSGQLVRDAEGIPIRTAGTTQDITETRRHEYELRQQSEQMRTIIENIPGGVSLMNGKQEFVAFNRVFAEILDLPEALLQRQPVTLRDLALFNARRGEYGPGDPEQLADNIVKVASTPQPHVFERVRPDNKVLEVRGAPLPDGGFVTIYTDITARKQAAERLLLAEKVFDNSPEAIMITDHRNQIVSVNAAFERITGFSAEEAVGKDPRILASGAHDREFYRSMWETLQATGHWAGEIIDRRKGGDTYPKWMTINAVTDQMSGALTHYVAIFNDITERKQAEERIRFLAHHDALTGLPNRFSLEARLEQSLIEARRYDWRVGVMFIDLDRFKMINDTLGHHIGDQLLIEVARRFTAAVRESDTVARLGGDEFVIVLPDLPHPSAAAHVAEKIIAALALPIVIDGHELHTSPSIGIGVYPDDGLTVDNVMKNADTAMYHAKALGRNNFQFFAAEMNQATNDRLSIESRLRRALDNKEFTLHYQPQFDAQSMRLTGVEALIRWQPPDSALVPPDRFIGIAEENGLIIPIGNWVLREACRQMKAWQAAGLPALRVAVNLSAKQLRNNDLAGTVADILAETKLPPGSLELELTESAVMEKPEEAIKVLKALKSMGISLAIDDFGTGYSSLAYLKLFPIDHLKIDRSFVRDIERDANDAAIAASTIALAHSLGLKVVAEGVETPAQLAMLRQHGCDELQGFLFSRPLPQEAIPAFTLEVHTESSRRLH